MAETVNLAKPRDDLGYKVAYTLATFFGAGRSPAMPGTVGSLASLLIWAPLVMFQASLNTWLYLLLGLMALGFWSTRLVVEKTGKEDPQQVVIDEVVGQGIALIWCGPHVLGIVAGFVLFRLFDIIKPWPASAFDVGYPGALGVMLDDIVAGFYAAFCVVALQLLV